MLIEKQHETRLVDTNRKLLNRLLKKIYFKTIIIIGILITNNFPPGKQNIDIHSAKAEVSNLL
jgi:hypothetical protein